MHSGALDCCEPQACSHTPTAPHTPTALLLFRRSLARYQPVKRKLGTSKAGQVLHGLSSRVRDATQLFEGREEEEEEEAPSETESPMQRQLLMLKALDLCFQLVTPSMQHAVQQDAMKLACAILDVQGGNRAAQHGVRLPLRPTP